MPVGNLTAAALQCRYGLYADERPIRKRLLRETGLHAKSPEQTGKIGAGGRVH